MTETLHTGGEIAETSAVAKFLMIFSQHRDSNECQ